MIVPQSKTRHSSFYYNIKEYLQAYAMLLPQLIGFALFSLYPIIWVLRFAWFDYDGIKAEYIGFDNFVKVFRQDPDYWISLINTFVMAFGKLLVELPLALILAVFLNNKLRGKSFFRAMFFMPNIVSVAIVGLIYYFMFSTFEGIVNNLLMEVKLIKMPIDWFGDKWTSMLVIAIASIWQNFGINMLFFLSGLQNIPQDLYECADIDGANKFQQFVHITMPMLAPVMQIIFMLAMLGSLKMTDLILVLTNGGPAGQTEVVMTYIFKYFFKFGEGSQIPQIGYAASLGMVTAVILGILTLLYLKMTKKMSSVD